MASDAARVAVHRHDLPQLSLAGPSARSRMRWMASARSVSRVKLTGSRFFLSTERTLQSHPDGVLTPAIPARRSLSPVRTDQGARQEKVRFLTRSFSNAT